MTSAHDPTTATVRAHAVRCWEAEVENARRISNRENGILGVIAMLLGLDLFRGPDAQELQPAVLYAFARGLLVASVLLALVALGLVLWMRGGLGAQDRGAPLFASAFLSWRGTPRLMSVVVLDEREGFMIATEFTTRGAVDLLGRNVRRKRTLDASQRFPFGAAASAGTAMSCSPYLSPGAPR